MNRQLEYLRHCAWCLEQAADAECESQRVMLVHIAETWKRLAENARKMDGSFVLH